jgi:excisionase family DNA binding protein
MGSATVGSSQRVAPRSARSQGSGANAQSRPETVGFRVRDDLLLPFSPRSAVSTSHAAELLDVSIRTVMRMCESGELRAYKIRGGKSSSPWRISYESLVACVERLHKEHGLEKHF